MANVTLRLVKGSPLTNQEVDNNFSNLNIFKTEIGGDLGGNVFYPTVIGLQGRSVSNVSPANLQVLSWSESANAWVPGNAASSYSDLQTKPAVNVTITGDVTGGANVLLVNTNTNNLAINVSYDYDNLDSRFLKLHNPTTQYVTSYIEFQGNITFAGNVTTIAANNLIIEDNFIYLASNNFVSNDDFGFAGNYNDGIYAHAGFFRDASDNGTWKIFEGYLPEPSEALNIDTDNASFRLANLAINALTANTIQGIVSTAVVTNLNADLLDGQQGVYYTNYANQTNNPAANIIVSGAVLGTANVLLTANTNIISIVTASNSNPGLNVSFTGDVTGSGNLNILNAATNLLGISLTIAPNSVALGTDTTGSYTDRVVGGTGISVTGTADEGNVLTASLADTGVVASTYGNATIVPVITIDAQGRITSASNVTIAASGGGGGGATLTSANNFIVVAGSCSITSTGCNNIFIGADAGACTTFGKYNFFAGRCAGFCNTTGCNNIFFGTCSGYFTTTGRYNNFQGQRAGYCNSTGCHNNFFGRCAGYKNTTGCFNTFFGQFAGCNNTTGVNNNFFGCGAGRSNTSGTNNNFFGSNAGGFNDIGNDNNFFGISAGSRNTLGSNNIFFGNASGFYNSTASNNIFMGGVAGYYNTTGCNNFFGGYGTGYCNTTGSHNIFIGQCTGYNNTTGSYNLFAGKCAGGVNTTSFDNVFLGNRAGQFNDSGSRNLFFGMCSGGNITTGNDNIILGNISNNVGLIGDTSNTIIMATGGVIRYCQNGVIGNTNITGNVIATAYYGDGSKLTGISTGSSSWLVKTANYTAASGDKIIANSSASSFVITLPSSPNVGDNIVIADGNNWSVTSINVSRNSSTIENVAEDFTLDVPGVVVDFIYDGSTWKTYVTSGDSGNVVYADKFYDLNNPNYYLDPSEGSVSLVAKGNLSTEGNVVASYFVGDGSKLTGLSAGGATLTSPANNFIVIAGTCSITSTGCNNIFIGANAGACTTFGKHNFFAGQCAGYCNTTGNYNTFLGSGAGRNVTLGTNNIIIGGAAGSSNTSNTIILATGTIERIKTEGDLGNTSITGNVTANAFIGNGNLLTQVNADTVDGIHIAVVTSLPGSPDPNTLYIVTG